MFGRNNKQIRVDFYEADSGRALGYNEIRLRDIPKTFKEETKVEIEGRLWVVVDAVPDKRGKIRREGEMAVRLRPYGKAEAQTGTIMPDGTLYRSPSRADIFPEFIGNRTGKYLLEIGKWDWRQIEFVSAALHEEVAAELQLIRDISEAEVTEQDGKLMFHRQHVRALIGEPLRGLKLMEDDLFSNWFPFSLPYEGLTMMGEEGVAADVFAMKSTAGISYYGLGLGKQVFYIALVPPMETHNLGRSPDIDHLLKFMQDNVLNIVDWDELRVVGPLRHEVLHLLTGEEGRPMAIDEEE